MSRSSKIRDCLESNINSTMTASEIMVAIGEEKKNYPFISSYLTTSCKSGKHYCAGVRECKITGRVVKAYQFHDPKKNNNSQYGSYTAQKKDPPPFEKFIPRVEKKESSYDARKKFIDELQKKLAMGVEKNRLLDQKKLFASITGYNGNSRSEAKKYYYQFARKYHPDLGGNQDMFIKLKQSWEYIQESMEN